MESTPIADTHEHIMEEKLRLKPGNGMPLHRLRYNGGDICDLLKLHRDTPYVFMHMNYPYENELVAICKHYTNAYADMCWAWIINPAASVRFLKEFLMAAPATKIFTFGGDYRMVETAVENARELFSIREKFGL